MRITLASFYLSLLVIHLKHFITPYRAVVAIECDKYFLRTAAGIGVFAGRNHNTDESMCIDACIPTGQRVFRNTILVDYLEGLNETHRCITPGICWLLNYMPASEGIMITKSADWNDSNGGVKQKYLDYFPFAINYKLSWHVSMGEQFFIDYGEHWFENNGLAIPIYPRRDNIPNYLKISNMRWLKDPSKALPGCSTLLTSFDKNEHTLRAAVKILKNEVIETTRALLFNDNSRLYLDEPISKYIWRSSEYDPSQQYADSDYWENEPNNRSLFVPFNNSARYSMIVLGKGLLYSGVLASGSESDNRFVGNGNASSRIPRVSSKQPNVRYSWFAFGDELLERCPEGTKCTREGVVCRTQMLISFTATRDIQRGEELIIPLYVDAETGFRRVSPEFSRSCLIPGLEPSGLVARHETIAEL